MIAALDTAHFRFFTNTAVTTQAGLIAAINAANASGGAGNGLTDDVLIQGGGIYNTGNLSITSTSILDNVAIASITNGSLNPGDVDGNGNLDGNNDATANNGNGNGNGVVGNVTVQGGGIFNVEVLSLHTVTIAGNDAPCNVTNGNGSDNGNDNSDADSGDNNGSTNGNGVTGNVEVAGAGIYNNDQANIYEVNVNANFASCSVTNGSNNGGSDAVNTNSADGSTNGDGVVGNISVSGGGITNDSAGSATITLGSITGNTVSCGISNGNNNGSSDGDNNTGIMEGKNNGNGVVGSAEVSGGGLDNESGGYVTLTPTSPTAATTAATASARAPTPQPAKSISKSTAAPVSWRRAATVAAPGRRAAGIGAGSRTSARPESAS